MTYFSETFEGDEVGLLVSLSEDRLYYVLGKRSKEQSNVFAMQVGCESAATDANMPDRK